MDPAGRLRSIGEIMWDLWILLVGCEALVRSCGKCIIHKMSQAIPVMYVVLLEMGEENLTGDSMLD